MLACAATPARAAVGSLAEAAMATVGFAPGPSREGIAWLTAHGGRDAVAVMVRLLRYYPEAAPGLLARLRQVTGDDPGEHWFEWMAWLQARKDFPPFEGFDAYLSALLASLDPGFRRFIRPGVAHAIPLSAIVWGGVSAGDAGIPPLDHPPMERPGEADWLAAEDRVFGVVLGGEARAYPLRIVDWHEMVNDHVGGRAVTLADCTLCGAGVLYDAADFPGGFGTSGLLWKSNKLMFDRATGSLWDQFTGEAVVGSAVGSGRTLAGLPMVLTRWGPWRQAHPATLVLSRRTGFERDYSEGAAYRDYDSSADLMFPAAARAGEAAKARVFGVVVAGGTKAWPLSSLGDGVVINDRVGFVNVTILGTGAGARAYATKGEVFSRDGAVLVAQGARWRVTEAALLGPRGEVLARIPGRVAFWFAWSGFYEASELGK
jgi:hypothetical protein